MANTHEGHFPDEDTGGDGYSGVAPVARFSPNGYGLYDMAGNVWQWTSDWYRPDYYQKLKAGGVARRTTNQVRAVINVKTAQAMGLTVNRDILLVAQIGDFPSFLSLSRPAG